MEQALNEPSLPTGNGSEAPANHPTSSNPYAAPLAQVGGVAIDEEFQHPRLFAVSGRMGRIRYLGYFIGVYLAGTLLMMGAFAGFGYLGARSGLPSIAIMVVTYGGVFTLWFMLAIQRCHDLDNSGWMSLLCLIPLINLVFFLYLLFMPGDKEPNRFGPPSVPNSVALVILSCALPVMMLLGLLMMFAMMPDPRRF